MRSFSIAVLLSLIALAGLWAGETPAAPAGCEIDLRLLHAIMRQGPQTPESPSILCTLRREGERWERVWGVARSMGNPGLLHGRVKSATVAADQMRFDLEFEAIADPGLISYVAIYAVDLARKDGVWRGTYTGVVNQNPVTGVVEASIPPASPATGRAPAKSSDHPRVLFRAEDLPALREKAKTPFGQTALAKFDGPLGAAMKYRLLSDPAQAATARSLVETAMGQTGSGDKMHRGRPWGWRLEQIGLAYDLCADAWDEPFKASVRAYVARSAARVLMDWGTFHQEIGWSLSDGTCHPPVMYAGAGLALLATIGGSGPEQLRPNPTLAGSTIAALAGWTPAEGTPVQAFASGKPPADWLCAGGFKPAAGQDVLTILGGAAARPAPGQALTVGSRTQPFTLLSTRKKGFTGSGGIDITNAFDRILESQACFFTVIRNDAARWVRIQAKPDSGCLVVMSLSGKVLSEGDCVRLEPGLHSLLITSAIGTASDWGVIGCTPTLSELGEDEAKPLVAWQQQAGTVQQALYEQGRASARAWGEDASSELVRLHEMAAFYLRMFCRLAISDGGFGGSSNLALEGAGKYLACYRQMMGRNVSPWPDATNYLQRRMFVHRYGKDGADLVQAFLGDPGFVASSYGEQPRDTTLDVGMLLLPLVPAEQQPAIAWLLQRAAKAGAGDLEKLLDAPRKPYNSEQGYVDSIPVHTFVNYPLSLTAKAPGECLPLAWSSTGEGWYGIRSGWQGGDEFIVQVNAHSGSIPAQNAGAFRVLGLGREWIKGMGGRWSEPVVQLYDNTLAGDARGKVTAVEQRPGLLSVSMDLSAVYAEANSYERYGAIPSRQTPSGITGLRAFAVDLTGASGSPCLIAVVDRVSGGGPKTWSLPFIDGQFKVPCPKIILDEHNGTNGVAKSGLSYAALLKKHEAAAKKALADFKASAKDWAAFQKSSDEAVAGVTLAEDGFTIQKPEGALRATFAIPRKPTLEKGTADKSYLGAKCAFGFQALSGIRATGGDDYFVVLTIQPGASPQVVATGSTLEDAVVTVGKRTIRFAQDRIQFGDR